jgi:hypothetical protein
MVWYSYFFLSRGKPSTHIAALSRIDDNYLLEKTPPVFKKIIERIKEMI